MNAEADIRQESDGRWRFNCSCGESGEFGWSKEHLAIADALVHADAMHGGAITTRSQP
jgi:hypothetical protein